MKVPNIKFDRSLPSGSHNMCVDRWTDVIKLWALFKTIQICVIYCT